MDKGKFLDLHRHLPSTAFVTLVATVVAAFAGVLIYTGLYNIGADAPHSKVVTMVLQQLRERAIKHHSRNIVAPADLNDPKRLAIGAGLYTEMCSGCHLGPGLEKSEMSQGLYPPAPELARGTDRSAAEQFWIVKHGVKLSAMPAWDLARKFFTGIALLPVAGPAASSHPEDHDAMMKDMPGMSGMKAMAPTDDHAKHPH